MERAMMLWWEKARRRLVPPGQRGVVLFFQGETVVDVEGTEYVAIFAYDGRQH